MVKEIISWSAMAFYGLFMLKMIWPYLRELWQMAEAEQALESFDEAPDSRQWWWGCE